VNVNQVKEAKSDKKTQLKGIRDVGQTSKNLQMRRTKSIEWKNDPSMKMIEVARWSTDDPAQAKINSVASGFVIENSKKRTGISHRFYAGSRSSYDEENFDISRELGKDGVFVKQLMMKLKVVLNSVKNGKYRETRDKYECPE